MVAEIGEDLAGFVGTTVVDDDDLSLEREGEEATDDFADGGFFVEGGHDDGDGLGVVRRRWHSLEDTCVGEGSLVV